MNERNTRDCVLGKEGGAGLGRKMRWEYLRGKLVLLNGGSTTS